MKTTKKNRRIVISILVALLTFFEVLPARAGEILKVGYTNISALEAMQIINTHQNVIILDVRGQAEFSSGHLTGSLSLPLQELEKGMNQFNRNATLVVYCQNGEKSAAACELLSKIGFKSIYNVSDGLNGWNEAGFPVISTGGKDQNSGRQLPLDTDHSKTPHSAYATDYCYSSGGSHSYEYIQSAAYSILSEGVVSITVIVAITNPTGCTYGNPCPAYDNSPEYINAWIDWNGNYIFEEDERVLNAALTGYIGINYYGSMSTSNIVTVPGTFVANTWMRVNLGWAYDPNDPCESSWTWGDVVDQPVQITGKTPRIKDITITGFPVASTPITNDPSLAGVEKVKFEAEIEEQPEYEITEVNWSGDIQAGKGNPYEYVASPGSHGNKNVIGTITFKNKSNGVVGTHNLSETFNLFFNKNGDDDGNSEPNWFKYWKSDGAVPNMSPAKYDAASSAFGYMTGTGELNLTPHSAGQHYSSAIVLNTHLGTESFGGPAVKGIDCTAEIIGHENYHKWVNDQWKTGGTFNGQTNSDKDKPDAGCNDKLPNFYETATSHTSNDSSDTYDLEHKKSSTYRTYGDNEYMAMRTGDGARGTAEKDWAYPGKQTETAYDEAMLSPASPLTYEPVLAQFTGIYLDAGVDVNSDGSYEYLRITAGINVTAGGLFKLVAILKDNSSTQITLCNKPYTLGSGLQTMLVEFEGLAIQEHGVDGPYKVTLLLSNEFGDELDYRYDVYNTASYDNNAFKKKDAYFTAAYSDFGTDSDSDGLFDYLTVQAGVNVASSGSYVLEGGLYSSDGDVIAMATSNVTLSAGNKTVTLNFDGKLINQKRIQGPYHMRYLNISKGDAGDFIYDAYITEVYDYHDFQGTKARMDEDLTEYGTDLDSDERYDSLTFEVGIEALVSGQYTLIGYLYDPEDKLILMSSKITSLNTGENTIELQFDGIKIYKHGVDGPYALKYLSLQDEAGDLMDILDLADLTAAYNFTDFQKPPNALVVLTGNYTDYKTDIDADEVYEFLTVEAEINLADSGHVVIKAKLEDADENEIVWAESIVKVAADNPQVVQLNFDGLAIYNHGVNGPYRLKNVYIYHTGDPTQPDYVADAYTTNAYLCNEFDTIPGVSPIREESAESGSADGYSQNYPNPFTPPTTIAYYLPGNEFITLKIYDLAGQEKETLVNGYQTPGKHEVVWEAEGLSSGIYFYRLQIGNYSETKKLVLKK